MAELNEGAHALGLFHTGATANNLPQVDPDLSLGGKCSSTEAEFLTCLRTNPISGIMILSVAGHNPVGNGILKAVGSDKLQWTPPTGSAGTAVTILNGQTKVISGPNPNRYLVVSRVSSLPLSGTETVSIMQTYGTVAVCSDFTGVERVLGSTKVRGLIMKNRSSSPITDIRVWVDTTCTGWTKVAKQTLTDGVMPAVQNETTMPVGILFSNPTSENSFVSLGNLNPGEGVGLWLQSYILANVAASARKTTLVWYRFTWNGVNYFGLLSGHFRIANDSLERWEAWIGQDADPAPTTAPASVNATVSPFYAARPAGHEYRVRVCKRSRYDLLGPWDKVYSLYVNDGGQVSKDVPNPPHQIWIEQLATGEIRIHALYEPTFEAGGDPELVPGRRATKWVIYYTTNGTQPQYATPVIQDMNLTGSTEYLSYTIPAQLDGTPVSVLIKTRRVDGTLNRDSKNVNNVSLTVSMVSPGTPVGTISFGRAAGVYVGAASYDDMVTWVDQSKNIYWEMKAGETLLWADGVLVFRFRYLGAGAEVNGVWTTFRFKYQDVTGNTSSVDGVLIDPSWPASKTLYIPVGQDFQMQIDLLTKTVFMTRVSQTEPAQADIAQPIIRRYSTTSIQVWSPLESRFYSVMSLHPNGDVRFAIPVRYRATEAEVLA